MEAMYYWSAINESQAQHVDHMCSSAALTLRSGPFLCSTVYATRPARIKEACHTRSQDRNKADSFTWPERR